MNCTTCQKLLVPDAKFCTNCGAPVIMSAPVQTPVAAPSPQQSPQSQNPVAVPPTQQAPQLPPQPQNAVPPARGNKMALIIIAAIVGGVLLLGGLGFVVSKMTKDSSSDTLPSLEGYEELKPVDLGAGINNSCYAYSITGGYTAEPLPADKCTSEVYKGASFSDTRDGLRVKEFSTGFRTKETFLANAKRTFSTPSSANAFPGYKLVSTKETQFTGSVAYEATYRSDSEKLWIIVMFVSRPNDPLYDAYQLTRVTEDLSDSFAKFESIWEWKY